MSPGGSFFELDGVRILVQEIKVQVDPIATSALLPGRGCSGDISGEPQQGCSALLLFSVLVQQAQKSPAVIHQESLDLG